MGPRARPANIIAEYSRPLTAAYECFFNFSGTAHFWRPGDPGPIAPGAGHYREAIAPSRLTSSPKMRVSGNLFPSHLADTQLTWEPQTSLPSIPGPLRQLMNAFLVFPGQLISGAQVTQLHTWSRPGERPRASDPRGPLQGGNCARSAHQVAKNELVRKPLCQPYD